MTRQFDSNVISNRTLSEDYFELKLEWPGDLVKPEAGQFVSIKTPDFGGSLLKRPFAISAFDGKTFTMIIQRRGPATTRFSKLKPGETINVTGPLGKPFPLPAAESAPVLLGGGIGLGPMVYLATELLNIGFSPKLILGYRSKNLVPALDGLEIPEPALCTDDGTEGFAGNIVQYLEQHKPAEGSVMYACGPDRMLQACEQYCQNNGYDLWISVEQIMACGVGACMGCAVKVNDPDREFVRVCKEGPVFPGGYIKWT